MKSANLIHFAALALFATPAALASTTWFVDGVHGNDNNSCLSRKQACKTISNAISATLPGDTILVAPAVFNYIGYYLYSGFDQSLGIFTGRL